MSRCGVRRFVWLIPIAIALIAPWGSRAQESAVRVALFEARGVGPRALDSAQAALDVEGITATRVTPEQVRAGALDDADVVVFTGGRGSVQGQLLGEDGRARVRRFVERGGGYVGICAGAFLAMQGPAEFHKIAIVAGHNLTGDLWRRGTAAARVIPTDGSPARTLHYENGPLFAPEEVEGLAPYVTLATFDADIYWEEYGTRAGEMPGAPAVVASSYGRGRILLFSPNPTMDPASPELLAQAVRWSNARGRVTPRLRWRDVF